MMSFLALARHKIFSNKALFGLCDDPPPAYIDEANPSQWIAEVSNKNTYPVDFIAIDNCDEFDFRREDGTKDKRCDGVLTYDATLIFVELKQRKGKKEGNKWIREGEEQLRSTINYFEKTPEAKNYTTKKAYIANSKHPEFNRGRQEKLNNFLKETGYVLRIENKIVL
ncbi:MAG: hypothetical protein LBQ73_07600 [Tannerellaceae bacterium]|jgi:hypothetical protein|nr:hypothetical protein [Tannerellaceae bacterium]